jgi:hypothetical protein
LEKVVRSTPNWLDASPIGRFKAVRMSSFKG